MYSLRPAGETDRSAIEAFVRARWGSVRMVAHGRVFHPSDLPGFVAVDGEEIVGFVAHDVQGDVCEIALIDVARPGEGIGSALVGAAAAAAAARGCGRLRVVTTNDNLDALRFYQRRGFRLTTLRPGAVDEARRTLKPEIPAAGDHGIPIHDELEPERRLEGDG